LSPSDPTVWPECTKAVVERIEANIRAALDAMTPEERAAFWSSLPWPFRPGSRRQNCVICGGPTPPGSTLCEVHGSAS